MAAAAPASAVQPPPDSPSPHPSDASGSDDAGRRPSVGELGFMDVGDLGDSQFQGYFGGKEFDDLDFGSDGGGGSAASAGGGMGLRSRSFDGLATMLTGVLKDEADAVRRSVLTVDELVTRQRKNVDRLVNTGKEKVKGTLREVSRITRERRRRVATRMRRIITGDANKRVRDHLQEELKKPIRVKLKDKLSFSGGVFFLLLSQYMVLLHPQSFPMFYVLCMTPLLVIRYYIYKRLKYHYFLIDFCYFVHLMAVLHVLLWPTNRRSFQVMFAAANGPIVFAILAWRNSLVFHSLDKTTSLLVHVFPPLVTYCMRWHPADGQPLCANDGCSFDFWADTFGYPLVAYAVWQVAYLVRTEMIDRRKLEADPAVETSVRWFTAHRSGLRDGALAVARKIGWFAPAEELDGNTTKTKAVFCISQLVYTVVTLLPVKILFEYRWAHQWFLILIFASSVWNGAGFYIEVFSVRYREQIEKAIREHERRLRTGSVSSTGSEDSVDNGEGEAAMDEALQQEAADDARRHAQSTAAAQAADPSEGAGETASTERGVSSGVRRRRQAQGQR